jgi:hypothetical protein
MTTADLPKRPSCCGRRKRFSFSSRTTSLKFGKNLFHLAIQYPILQYSHCHIARPSACKTYYRHMGTPSTFFMITAATNWSRSLESTVQLPSLLKYCGSRHIAPLKPLKPSSFRPEIIFYLPLPILDERCCFILL